VQPTVLLWGLLEVPKDWDLRWCCISVYLMLVASHLVTSHRIKLRLDGRTSRSQRRAGRSFLMSRLSPALDFTSSHKSLDLHLSKPTTHDSRKP
jgi:hypothetical protein